MYSLLHRCFIDDAFLSAIFSKKPVFRGLNMKNLLHRCLIEKRTKVSKQKNYPRNGALKKKICLTVVDGALKHDGEGDVERYFEEVDRVLLNRLFERHGRTRIARSESVDELQEGAIMWRTEVFEKRGFLP